MERGTIRPGKGAGVYTVVAEDGLEYAYTPGGRYQPQLGDQVTFTPDWQEGYLFGGSGYRLASGVQPVNGDLPRYEDDTD